MSDMKLEAHAPVSETTEVQSKMMASLAQQSPSTIKLGMGRSRPCEQIIYLGMIPLVQAEQQREQLEKHIFITLITTFGEPNN